MKEQITNKLRAGYSGLYLVSYEEQRVEHDLRSVCNEREWGFYIWSITAGVLKHNDITKDPEQISQCFDPLAVLGEFMTLPEKSVLVLRDYHLFIGAGDNVNPLIVRKLKDALLVGRATNRVLAIVGCRLVLPPELEKELTVMQFTLPGTEELMTVAQGIAQSAGVTLNGNTAAIIDAGRGLTTKEFEDALALAHIESGMLDPGIISREKAETVKKGGLLEVMEPTTTLDDIGGLDRFKAHLHGCRNLFTKKARDYGLKGMRPLLVCGQPGTGKSLSALATRNVFRLPLIRLEASKLFGSLVGQTEGNWRSAFATAKAIAPCVFWLDEIDGLFSGAASSGQTDGGTTSRLCKTILQDLQMNGEGMLFFFTANDIDHLPDPLVDRCDVWSVDLPNTTERRAIWSIHIGKTARKADEFDVNLLADKSEGYSGRQIEMAWLKAMVIGFNEDREPSTEDALTVLKGMQPTSITMADAIAKRRQRLAGKAQAASSPEVVAVAARPSRKLA